MIAAGLLRSALDARSISSRKSFVSYCMLRVAKSSLDRSPTYKDLRVNMPLCQQYVDDMRRIGEQILVKDDESYTASTDMGKSKIPLHQTKHGSSQQEMYHMKSQVFTERFPSPPTPMSHNTIRDSLRTLGLTKRMRPPSSAAKGWQCWPFVS